MANSFSANTRAFTVTASLILTLGLSGCGGEDSGSSSGSSGSSGSGGGTSSSSACNYDDMISSGERTKANSCGIQVSGSYGVADSHLQQVIAACKIGEKAKADAHYNDVYKKAVKYAKDVFALECSSTNITSELPQTNTDTNTNYNMCGRVDVNVLKALCYGPVRTGVAGCGNSEGYTYMSQHKSSSACIAARDSWLKNYK